jgi:hypothetical protein
MTDTSLVKAAIINRDTGGPPIECMFNPKEYTFAKQNTWNKGEKAGENTSDLTFSSGGSTKLTLQLFFDTYEAKEDVRKKHTSAIWNLMRVDESLRDFAPRTGKGRPPMVRFQWGNTWSFDAVITSISQKFTLFLADGTPVRATLDVSFEQIKDEQLYPRQNPTSGGVGGERIWTVRHGDTLAGIAYHHYGDTQQWRRIADANRLTRVRRLTPGLVLVIPND